MTWRQVRSLQSLKKPAVLFVADLLAKALPEQDDALFQLAMDVENDPELVGMASDWDAVAGDGIEAR